MHAIGHERVLLVVLRKWWPLKRRPKVAAINALEDEADRALLTRISFRDEAPGGAAEVDGCLVTLRKTRLKKEHRDESRELDALSRDEQNDKLLKLMKLGHDMDAPHRDATH